MFAASLLLISSLKTFDLSALTRADCTWRNVIMHHNRPHFEDIRAMKSRGDKISMLFVTTREEAAAASAAGIHMLSIEGHFFDSEMREAAGDCFVQVGLPYGGWGSFACRNRE